MNIVIPMSGAGSRFSKAGFTFPKPLIEVRKKPMIQVVLENLDLNGNYIFIVQKKHCDEYAIKEMLNLLSPKCKIVVTDGLTEGAACSALLAREHIDNNEPLFFANSDQFIIWDKRKFFEISNKSNIDGSILTFKSTHPKLSFAKLNPDGFVSEVAEKKPISDIATCGYYYWKRGSDFVKFADQMIQKNIRVNNEFYICPVYNEAIESGKKIIVFPCEEMWSLGTPEDLRYFLENCRE